MLKRSGIVVGLAVMACVVLSGTWASAEDNEEKVPVKNLPKQIVAIVKAVCPGGILLSAERETDRRTGGVEYEVKVKQTDGKIVEVEVVLDKAGKIRKVQVGEDDDDDDDDDDD